MEMLRPLSAVSLMLVAAASATAQASADTARDTTRRLEAVTVTSARAATVVGGASAVVVKPEALRSSPAPLLEQALRESPFIHVRQNSRGEMELSVRGSDSRQAAVLLDGVPMSLGWDHRADPSLVPVTGTRSIVIVRGLGSLLNGPNTLGGTIQVEHGAGGGNDAWIGGGVDENGSVVTTAGGERVLTSSVAVRGGLAYRQRDGFALPSGASDPTSANGLRTNSDQTHVDGFASVRWSGARGRSAGLNVSGFEAERGVPPEEHISTPRFWRYPYHSRYVAALSASSGLLTTSLGTGSIDVGAGFNSGRYKIDIFADRAYSNVTGNELGNEKNLVGRVHASHSVGPATLRAAVTTSDVHFDETLNGAVASYRQLLWSAGSELEVPIGRTTIAGGLVFDQSSTPGTGGRPAQPTLDNTGWRAGLVRDVNETFRVHGSASRRSRFPALRELYSGAINRFQPNPDLKPETLLGFEGGLTARGSVASNATGILEATAFRHDLDDAVARITVPQPTGPSLFRRINRDRIRSSGVELLGAYVVGSGDRAISLSGDAMIQSVAIEDRTATTERHAENNPERRGSIELGAPLPLRTRGVATARYTGTQYCLNPDTGNEDTLAPETRADVALERSFSLSRGAFQTLRALVSVDNVRNAAVFDQCGLVQPGRTIRLMFVLR